MKTILRNIFALAAGWAIGAIVNMSLIVAGSKLFPNDRALDVMNAMDWDLKFFIFPFLAHALGTLAGAFIAAKIASTYKKTFALIIGAFFLIGGTMMVFMLPAPLWFIILDLTVAYIPMGWLGWRIEKRSLSN
jgi:hypothetical protein